MDLKALSELEHVSQPMLDAALNDFRLIATKAQKIEMQIADLEAAKRRQATYCAGGDGRILDWLAWCAREKSQLLRDLAIARSDMEAARQRAQTCFGRMEALAQVKQDLKEKERLLMARHHDQSA